MTASKTASCVQGKAFDAIVAHVKQCHPCSSLWAGIGKGLYEFCAEYMRLAEVHKKTECSCRARRNRP